MKLPFYEFYIIMVQFCDATLLNHQRNPVEVEMSKVSCGILENCVSATFPLMIKEGPKIIMTASHITFIITPHPKPQSHPRHLMCSYFPFIDHSRFSQPSSAFCFSLALIWLVQLVPLSKGPILATPEKLFGLKPAQCCVFAWNICQLYSEK